MKTRRNALHRYLGKQVARIEMQTTRKCPIKWTVIYFNINFYLVIDLALVLISSNETAYGENI